MGKILCMFFIVQALLCASPEAAEKKKIVYAPSIAQRVLGGSHVLRKLAEDRSPKGELSGSGFFLFFAGGMEIEGKTEMQRTVTFAWYSKAFQAYLINTIPVERVHVRVKNERTDPAVEFHLSGCYRLSPVSFGPIHFSTEYNWSCPADIYFNDIGDMNPQAAIDSGSVDYVTLTVNATQWPTQIQMPLNQ
jgi:hypothetical protein